MQNSIFIDQSASIEAELLCLTSIYSESNFQCVWDQCSIADVRTSPS